MIRHFFSLNEILDVPLYQSSRKLDLCRSMINYCYVFSRMAQNPSERGYPYHKSGRKSAGINASWLVRFLSCM